MWLVALVTRTQYCIPHIVLARSTCLRNSLVSYSLLCHVCRIILRRVTGGYGGRRDMPSLTLGLVTFLRLSTRLRLSPKLDPAMV